jgi:hypothetical protein
VQTAKSGAIPSDTAAIPILDIFAMETSRLSSIGWRASGWITSSVSMVAELLISELNELKTAPSSTGQEETQRPCGKRILYQLGVGEIN